MYLGVRIGCRSATDETSGYLLLSVAYASSAVANVRTSAAVRCCFERCIAVSKLGMAIAARIPTMAITNRPTTTTTTMIAAVFVPPFTAGRGAPFVGLPHDTHGLYETASTGAPQYAQKAIGIVGLTGSYHRGARAAFHHIMPSCSFAASDIMLRSHTGSKTTSTSALFTPGIDSILDFTSWASTGPIPQPGAVSVIFTFTFVAPSAPSSSHRYTRPRSTMLT